MDSLNFASSFLLGSMIAYNNFYYCYGTFIGGANNQDYLATLFKIDQNLDIVKQIALDESSNDFIDNHKITINNGSLYLANCHTASSTIHFFKTDLNLIKKDSTIQNGSILCDLANYGNKLIVCGLGFDQGSIWGNNQVMEMDTNFNVLSRFNLDSLSFVNPGCYQRVAISSPVAILREISNVKYAVTGYYPVVNSVSCSSKFQTVSSIIKNNNQILATNIVGNGLKDNFILGARTPGMKNKNYFYTVAESGYDTQNPTPPIQTNTTQILVNKIDTSGNLIWVKYFSEPDVFYSPYNMFETSDGGVVICGLRYNLIDPAVLGVGEGFVMKIDKNGNQVFVGITNNGNFKINSHKCYPNPSKDRIYFEIPLDKGFEITIYDILGQQLLVENRDRKAVFIDISEFPTGTYLYKIQTEQSNISGKFIKE